MSLNKQSDSEKRVIEELIRGELKGFATTRDRHSRSRIFVSAVKVNPEIINLVEPSNWISNKAIMAVIGNNPALITRLPIDKLSCEELLYVLKHTPAAAEHLGGDKIISFVLKNAVANVPSLLGHNALIFLEDEEIDDLIKATNKKEVRKKLNDQKEINLIP